MMEANSIITGDCLEVLPSIPAGSVALIVTSPEYPGQRANSKTAREWLAWFDDVAAELVRVLADDGVLALNLMFKRRGPWFDTRLFTAVLPMLEGHRLNMIDLYCWDKMNPVPAGDLSRYDVPAWEPVFVMAKGPDYQFYPVYGQYNKKTLVKLKSGNKTRGPGINGNYANGHSRINPLGARQGNVLHISSSGDQGRPRAKGGSFPRQLAQRFIMQHTRLGDLVLDPCAGVGTTCREAQIYGRRYIGIEIDPAEAERARVWLGQQVTTSKDREALPLLALAQKGPQ